MSDVHNWEELNQACLMGELAELRAALAKLLSPPETPADPTTALPTEEARSALECGREAAAFPPPSEPASSLQVAPYQQAEAQAAASRPHSKAPAADTLCAELGLTSFERKILLMCAGVELDSGFASLCAAANQNLRTPLPTFSLALAAFADAHWSALLPGSPLRYWRLIDMAPGDSLTTSALRIDERILHYLTGLTSIDERLRGLTKPVPVPVTQPLLAVSASAQAGVPGPSVALPPSQRAVAESVAAVWSRVSRQAGWPAVQLCGADLAGKRAVAAAACAALGLHLRSMPSSAVPRAVTDLDLFLRLWEREAALERIALLVETDDGETLDAQGDATLKRMEESLHGPLLISTRELQKPVERRVISFDVPAVTSTEQLAVWKQALGPAAAALDGRVEALVCQFNLSPGVIHAAVEQVVPDPSPDFGPAVTIVAPDYRPASAGLEAGSTTATPATTGTAALAEALWDVCRIHSRPRLEGLAQRLEPVAAWDDLVLPELPKQLLRQIAVQVRQRSKVYQTWGFATKGARGLGISALFAGPSGTGKTMAGEVLANELRLDLYRIDLSQVVSKYIGETEKNLRRVFDAAEEGAAILLFDEADALFGKRSEVKDSHDRYANIEVGYLLQRMEAYRGLAILTTNRKEALDHAFLRRIRFVVEFPFPAGPQRAEIWRRVFPRATPTEGLRIERLARLSATGGNIYNIAMGAAFLAADAGEPVRMSHLLTSARSEFAKLEHPLTEAETVGWA